MTRSETKEVPTLIVLAWGCPPRLDAMIGRLGPVAKRVVLIDPVPGSDRPAILRDHDGVLRIAAVAGPGDEGQARLDRYSLPGLFALAPATGALTTLFPGLERTGSLTVDRIGPEALAARLADLPRPFDVVIDTPGAEHLVIDALEAAQLRDDIARISLCCGLEPFFEGALDAQALRDRLRPDFRLVEETGSDPDWPELVFEADAAARRIASLEAALERRKTEMTELRARLEETIGTVTAERDEARAEHQAMRETVARLEEDAAQQKTEMARNIAERDRLQTDLGLALRMQGVLQSDLDDLRQAYRRSEEQRREHEALLRKLTPRLQEAAQQLRDLHLLRAEETARPEAVTRADTAEPPPQGKGKRKSRAKGKKTGR